MVAMHSTRRRGAGRRPYGRGLVCLVHLERPYHHARHYVGYTENLEQRMHEHRAGHGSRLLAAVVAAGVSFEVAFIWRRASRLFERQVHRYKNTPRFCPACTGSDHRAHAYTPRALDRPTAARNSTRY